MPVLELCLDTPAGIAIAVAGGADRIELCSALALGGLTPSPGLVAAAIAGGLPVSAMIRPHEGDFRYESAALAVMAEDIDHMAAQGVAGVVFGATDGGGGLDLPALERLLAQVRASDARHGTRLHTTLHRAIDLCADLPRAVDQAIALGFDRILSSGGATTAAQGSAVLAAMRARAGDRCEIVAGAGISAANVAALVSATGIGAVHASCRASCRGDRPGDPAAIALGFGGACQATDAHRVAALRAALDG